MEVKFKRLNEDACLPTRANNLDAGFDLYAAAGPTYGELDTVVYSLGLAVAIPAGYVGLVFPRSSVCKKTLSLTNSVGVIDAGYRGEVRVVFRDIHATWVDGTHDYDKGDRIAQLIVMPLTEWQPVWADELPVAGDGRGTGGYGSSGK